MKSRLRISLSVVSLSCVISCIVLPTFDQEFVLPFSRWSLFDQDFANNKEFDLLIEKDGQKIFIARNPRALGMLHFNIFHASQQMGMRIEDPEEYLNYKQKILSWTTESNVRPIALVRLKVPLHQYFFLEDDQAQSTVDQIYEF